MHPCIATARTALSTRTVLRSARHSKPTRSSVRHARTTVRSEAMTQSEAFKLLASELKEIDALNGIDAILGWDELVVMKGKSAGSRAAQKSALAIVIHQRQIPRHVIGKRASRPPPEECWAGASFGGLDAARPPDPEGANELSLRQPESHGGRLHREPLCAGPVRRRLGHCSPLPRASVSSASPRANVVVPGVAAPLTKVEGCHLP